MTYKYISIKKYGGPDVLELVESDKLPEPKPNEIRVKVLKTSASFTDTLIRKGKYPDLMFKKPPITPGYDLIGVIDSVGKEVKQNIIGQKVAALTIIGAYSEYICLPIDKIVLVPNGLDNNEALAMILTFITAYQMLRRCAKIKNGQKILVHGAGGAVGTALLQLGKLMNLKIYGTASKSKHSLIKNLGGIPIDYNTEDFVKFLKDAEKKGIDAVFDPIGGDYFKRSLKTLKKEGTLVAFGFYKSGTGSGGSPLIGFLKLKLWSILPWFPNTKFYSIGDWHKKHFDWFREDLTTLFKLLGEKKIRPSIGKIMDLQEASLAHELIEKAAVKGKIVLTVN